MLDALLTSLGIGYERVHASIWKRQMGLFKMGKPGSMALAQQLLPQAAGDLRSGRQGARSGDQKCRAYSYDYVVDAYWKPHFYHLQEKEGPRSSRGAADRDVGAWVSRRGGGSGRRERARVGRPRPRPGTLGLAAR